MYQGTAMGISSLSHETMAWPSKCCGEGMTAIKKEMDCDWLHKNTYFNINCKNTSKTGFLPDYSICDCLTNGIYLYMYICISQAKSNRNWCNSRRFGSGSSWPTEICWVWFKHLCEQCFILLCAIDIGKLHTQFSLFCTFTGSMRPCGWWDFEFGSQLCWSHFTFSFVLTIMFLKKMDQKWTVFRVLWLWATYWKFNQQYLDNEVITSIKNSCSLKEWRSLEQTKTYQCCTPFYCLICVQANRIAEVWSYGNATVESQSQVRTWELNEPWSLELLL